MFEYLGNVSWTVLSEITKIRRAGDKQAAVGGRAAPTYVPIQTVAYMHNAGTSVRNKPISCLRVHARARTAQGYALAQARKSAKVDGPRRVSHRLFPHECLRVCRAKRKKVYWKSLKSSSKTQNEGKKRA